jgi:hypothetical protein
MAMLLEQVFARLLGEGQLTIIDEVGRPHRIEGARPGPSITLRLHSWWTGVRLALRPRLALGEAYMDGMLTIENGGDIYDLLDLDYQARRKALLEKGGGDLRQGRVLRAGHTDRKGGNRDAGRHLHNRQERIDPVE